MLEPGAHGEEGEVHGGGGGEEGGAGDEHPRAGDHHAQTQPTNIGAKLAQHATIKINLENILLLSSYLLSISIFIFTSHKAQINPNKNLRK